MTTTLSLRTASLQLVFIPIKLKSYDIIYTNDMWTDGASYEYYVGRWSRLVACQFLTWLDIPSGARWLDIGCGTGVLSQSIHGPSFVESPAASFVYHFILD
jgi:2-polyprenyl-3-methyl-5-hydroxy-6-metoxy-1,4-benzoquinol methylase